MRDFLVVVLLGCVASSCSPSQPERRIVETAQFVSGTVLDAVSREPLPGATVYWDGNLWQQTGDDGQYSLGGFGTLSGEVTFSAAGFVSQAFEMPNELPTWDPEHPADNVTMDVLLERQ